MMIKSSIFSGSKKSEGFSRGNAFPEGIVPGNWEVKSADTKGAYVAIVNKQLVIPFGDNIKDICIRNHEYSHIRWSPDNLGEYRDDIDLNAIRAFEDTRVDILATKRYVNIKYVFTKEDAERYQISDNKVQYLLDVIVSRNYEGYKTILERSELSPMELEIINDIYKNIYNNCNSFSIVKKLAIDFTELFREKPEEEKKIEKSKDDKIPKEPRFKVVSDLPKKKGKYIIPTAESLSGKMNIIENLEMTSKSILKAERRIDCGYTLKYPQRIYTDKLCFTVRKRVNKIGTILCDCSGSMDIDYEQLKRIVEKSNGATIAGYGGRYKSGNLYILSRNGRLVKEIPSFGGSNVIDYWALLWLAKQKKPMIFISDGLVTGIEDIKYPEVTTECFKIIQKNGIINVLNLDNFEKLIDDEIKRIKR